MNRFLRILATALITAGLVVALDVGLTLAWKEPLSSLYGSQAEPGRGRAGELEQEFPTRQTSMPWRAQASLEERVAGLADRFEDRVVTGKAIGRITDAGDGR